MRERAKLGCAREENPMEDLKNWKVLDQQQGFLLLSYLSEVAIFGTDVCVDDLCLICHTSKHRIVDVSFDMNTED